MKQLLVSRNDWSVADRRHWKSSMRCHHRYRHWLSHSTSISWCCLLKHDASWGLFGATTLAFPFPQSHYSYHNYAFLSFCSLFLLQFFPLKIFLEKKLFFFSWNLLINTSKWLSLFCFYVPNLCPFLWNGIYKLVSPRLSPTLFLLKKKRQMQQADSVRGSFEDYETEISVINESTFRVHTGQ